MLGKISGIHHVTAIAGEPQRNLDFYSGVLGLKLVKLTVNHDDPATYHFYFRGPGGVLYEIATDSPGFSVDDPLGRLGSRLVLPPRLESLRPRLEKTMPPVRIPERVR